jgi:hypothetical protein
LPAHVPTEFDVATMLREVIDSQSSASASFGPEDATVTVPYIVDVEQLPQDSLSWIWNDIVCVCLGYPRADGKVLRREPPVRHPLFPSLYATRILNMRGAGPMDYFWSEGSEPPPPSPAPPVTPETVIQFENLLLFDPKQVGWWKFKRILFEVEYTLPAWDIRTDEETEFEYLRNCVIETESDLESYEFQAGSFRFVDLFDAQGKPRPFASTTAAVLSKKTYRVTWRDVPSGFLMPENKFFPDKFDRAVGRVNDAEFLGCAAGTLLCKPIRIARKKRPVFITEATGTRTPTVVYDCWFEFSHFDPPRPAGATNDVRGHNLFPARTDETIDSIEWHFATNTGQLTGQRLFRSFDFASLFTHWSL